MEYEDKINRLSQQVTVLEEETAADISANPRMHYRNTSEGAVSGDPSSPSAFKAAVLRVMSQKSELDSIERQLSNASEYNQEDNEGDDEKYFQRQSEMSRRHLLNAEMEKSRLEDEMKALREQLEDRKDTERYLREQIDESSEELRQLRGQLKREEDMNPRLQVAQKWSQEYESDEPWYDQLSVKQAKVLCKDNNIDTSRCVEKKDLQKLLQSSPRHVKRDAENRGFIFSKTRDVGVMCSIILNGDAERS